MKTFIRQIIHAFRSVAISYELVPKRRLFSSSINKEAKKKICVQNIFLSYLKLFSKCWRDRYDRMEKYYLLKTFL